MKLSRIQQRHSYSKKNSRKPTLLMIYFLSVAILVTLSVASAYINPIHRFSTPIPTHRMPFLSLSSSPSTTQKYNHFNRNNLGGRIKQQVTLNNDFVQTSPLLLSSSTSEDTGYNKRLQEEKTPNIGGGSTTTTEKHNSAVKHQHRIKQSQQHLQTNKRYKTKLNSNPNQSNKKRRVRTMFRQAKEMERTGQWGQACTHLKKILELDPFDSYTHLALCRLQSRKERGNSGGIHVNKRYSKWSDSDLNGMEITQSLVIEIEPFSAARDAFFEGTQKCPTSIHLWQAWALHEESQGNLPFARRLFQQALSLDEINPYVCHGYGLLEHRCGNFNTAQELWERPLKSDKKGKSSAALVCSLGKLLVSKGKLLEARTLYLQHVSKIKSEREVSEVYLAAAWLEEKHFTNMDKAEELLNLVLKKSPGNSRAMVALARLEGRKVDTEKSNKNVSHKNDVVRRRDKAVKKKLEDACRELIKGKSQLIHDKTEKSEVLDGRLFNALADMEVKEKNYNAARNILKKGMELFPNDHTLPQAAGKVEERVGNFTAARDWYSASLLLAPSSPTLVAYALIELRHPIENKRNYTKVARLFDEALLLDPRHGPVYNAYGNMELKRGNIERARQIYQNGVSAHCKDLASVYHGLAMLELSLGNVETARLVLIKGLKEVKINDGMMDNNRRKRSLFLTHTLGVLELNSNRAAQAKAVFESGLERHGDSSQLLLGAALSELKLGNEDAARTLFERSVKVDRKHAQAWQSWGVMEMRAGNYKVAKTLFECGLKNDPRHGALWQAYATMESRLGNFEIARTLFAAGVTKCPDHVPLYQAWACLEVRGENNEKAKTLISEALTRDKSEGSGWLVAAKIEEKLGNKGLMAMILRRGLQCSPNSPEIYNALADYEIRRGKIDLV